MSALDGMRALAMLAVFSYHFGLPVKPMMAWHGLGYRVIPNLDLGVEIFFVLSGFLIFRPFAAANLAGAPRPALRSYFIRRATRIYPAYWVALTMFLVTHEVRIRGGFRSYLAHYALVHTYRPENLLTANEGLGPAWSLVVEVSFYAVVPVLGFALRRFMRRGHLVALGALTIGGFVTRFVTVDHPLNGMWHGYLKSFVGVLPLASAALAPGMMLAVISVTDAGRVRELLQRAWVFWSGAAVLFGLLMWKDHTNVFWPFRISGSSGERWHGVLAPLVAVALVAPIALAPNAPGAIRSLLRSRPVVWIGMVSFGAYLWHHPIILDSKKTGDHFRLSVSVLAHHSILYSLMVFALFLGVTLILAGLSWYGVERPIVAFARRVTAQRPKTTATDVRADADAVAVASLPNDL